MKASTHFIPSVVRFVALAFAFAALGGAAGQGALAPSSVVPERFATSIADVDFPGGDLGSILDVDVGQCLAACLRDDACVALTFDEPNGACFIKGTLGDAVAYPGAISATIRRRDLASLTRADAIASTLPLDADDLAAARAQAEAMAVAYRAGDRSEAAWLAAARRSDAVAATGAAVTVADSGTSWLAYAQALATMRDRERSRRYEWNSQTRSAAINAAVRLDDAGRPDALMLLASALEIGYRGRDALTVAREAERLRPGVAGGELDRLIDAFGFRLLDYDVDAATAAPRLCLNFSEPLSPTRDYAPFLQGDARGMSIEVSGAQLCLAGASYGNAYRFTLRAGLPSATGETTARAVTLEVYVRDRAATVRFPGRAYVLPATGPRALPIDTVNAPRLDLELLRIAPGNLAGVVRRDEFLRAFSTWEGEYFASEFTEPVWRGTVDVTGEINRDTRSLVPLDEVGTLEPGMYLLRASIPGANPYDSAPATQWFLVSDTGITAWWGNDGVHVIALALSTREPLVAADVTLIARSNRVLGRTQTDERGIAHFAGGIARGADAAAPAIVLIETANDLAVLSLGGPPFDLSDRGVAGRTSPGPIDAFLTTDRGVYRPGEVVNVTLLVRDATATAIADLPVVIELLRPDGVRALRIVSSDAGAGGHVLTLPLGTDVPRGAWRIAAYADPTAPPVTDTTILVEDFIPERIDVAITLPDEPLPRGATALQIDARHDFGAAATNFTVTAEAVLRPTTTLDAWPGFSFGPQDDPVDPRRITLPTTTTDEAGSATLRVDLSGEDLDARPYLIEVVATLSDAATRAVERRVVRAVQPTTPLLGIDPGFDQGLPENAEATFDLLLLDAAGAASAGMVSWRIDRIRTRYQWYARYGSWFYEPIRDRERVAGGDAILATEGARIAAGVTWGSFELIVTLNDDPTIRATFPFTAGYGGVEGAEETPDRLDLSLDASTYAPGDVARLRVAPDTAGTVIVAVLTDRVIDHSLHRVDGETVLDVPVTEAWGTGAYVSATLVAPGAGGVVPTRAIGIAHASVAPGARALTATLSAPIETRGGEPFTVTLTVADPNGAVPDGPVFATIAAVDAGALRLTGFTPPDPAAHYFAQRQLGVAIRDLYGRLIDARGGAMGRVRSGGGDMVERQGGGGPLAAEEVVSLFSGPIVVSDGRADVTFELPPFTGTVRVMAVVWSQQAVGAADTDVVVRDPIALRATLPRFMTPGDVSRLLLTLNHTSGAAGAVQIRVDGHGVGKVPSQITLAEGEERSVSVLLKPTDFGRHDLTVALTTPDGVTTERTFTLAVIATTPEIAASTRIVLAPGASLSFDESAFASYLPGTGRATLIGGPAALLDPLAAIDTLMAYPYGCTEQITSGLIPLLLAPDLLVEAGYDPSTDPMALVQRGVERILARQDRIGRFGAWRTGGDDLWLDASTTEWLYRAQAAGATVDAVALRLATERLRNEVAQAGDLHGDASAIAYALYTLAQNGAAAIGDLRYYADTLPDRFTTPTSAAMLAAALASYGERTRADAMFDRALTLAGAGNDERGYRSDHGTLWRDRVALLALALEAQAPARIVDEALTILRRSSAPRWRSTQEAAWAVRAAVALGAEGRGLEQDGTLVTGSVLRLTEASTITNASDVETTLTLTTFGIPKDPPPAEGIGMAIARAAFTPSGDAVDMANLSVGDRVVMVVEVTPDRGSRGGRFMIDAALPAGLEIDNPNLLASGDVQAFGWLGQVEAGEATEARADRFLAAIDRFDDDRFRVAFVARAVSPGTFTAPAALVTDMYRPTLRATTDTGQVTIRP